MSPSLNPYLAPVHLSIRICGYFTINRLEILVLDIVTKQGSDGSAELVKPKMFCKTDINTHVLICETIIYNIINVVNLLVMNLNYVIPPLCYV